MDKFEMIKQFKDLLDNGVITQEEFDQKKMELLSIGSDIQPQAEAELKPTADELINEVPASEKPATKATKATEEKTEIIEPIEKVEVMEPKPQMQVITAEQKTASKKGMILIGGAIAFFVLMLIGILGSGGSSGIKGSWNCYSVTYLGETITANEAQMDDYSFKFTSSTFEANIYGEAVSGTYEYSDTVTLSDGTEADVYALTTESGAELTVAYFKSIKLLTMSPFGGISDSTYIAFKRR